MVRVFPPNFNYQPNDSNKLNWDEAPPAPIHYRCVLEWNSRVLDKSYGGLVWAANVRDVLFNKYGVFGTFRTPALLDEEGVRKLCYLVVGVGDLRDYANGKYDRQSLVTTKRPTNYLPFQYVERPLIWARHQFLSRGTPQHQMEHTERYACVGHMLDAYQNANSKRSQADEEVLDDDLFKDANGHLVKMNDQVILVNCKKTERNGTIGTVYYREPCAPYQVTVYVPSIKGGTDLQISIDCLLKFIPAVAPPKTVSIHNLLLKLIPTRTDLPLVPAKSHKHVVDWSKMPPEGKRKRQTEQGVDQKGGLCDLGSDVKQHISSFLSLFDVERNLRLACRDTFWNFTRPPPGNLQYDFVYFKVCDYNHFNAHNGQWHGVAHTTNDVLVAIRNHDWGIKHMMIQMEFVQFDRNHPIVPLLRWRCSSADQPSCLDPFGCLYCGVQQASDVELHSSFIISGGCRFNPDPMIVKRHCVVFRHCRDWTPREPRILLRHIGPQVKACDECGHIGSRCRCRSFFSRNEFRIYYSPKWFEDRDDVFAFSAPSDSRDKSVIVFSEFNRTY